MTNPRELTYADYRDSVEITAEAVEESIEEYEDDYGDVHEAIFEHVDGTMWVIQHVKALRTVSLSDQNPENPDYCEPWSVYAEEDPTFRDVVQAAAYVCFYSDVVHFLKGRDAVDV